MQIRFLALAAALSLAIPAAQAQGKPAGTRPAQSLDTLVKRLRSEGYTISRLHRVLYADGRLKHYSFDAMPSLKSIGVVSTRQEHFSISPLSVIVDYSEDGPAASGKQHVK